MKQKPMNFWKFQPPQFKLNLIPLTVLLMLKLDSIKESQYTRFDSVDARFDSVDARFDSVDARFDSLDARFDSLDAKIDSVKESLDIWFGIILKWLKILTGVGVTVLLTMGIWLIRLMFTIGS